MAKPPQPLPKSKIGPVPVLLVSFAMALRAFFELGMGEIPTRMVLHTIELATSKAMTTKVISITKGIAAP